MEGKSWKAVPQFGAWDQKAAAGGGDTNYSMVFQQARANRKKHKDELTRHSLGNERELLMNKQPNVVSTHDPTTHYHVEKKKKMFSCLSCCIRP